MAHFFVAGNEKSVSTRLKQLEQLLEPVITALDCQLWGLEILGGGHHLTLRIYIEKSGGVALDDCERVSRQVSAVLDVEDPISGEYTLEVSSPGMARPLYRLAQYAEYIGEDISLRLKTPYEGRRKFNGQLRGVEGDEVILLVGDHEYLFPVESIEKANIVPNFGNEKERLTDE